MKHTIFSFHLHLLLLLLIINITAATRDFPASNIPIHVSVSEQGRKEEASHNKIDESSKVVAHAENAMDLMGLVEEQGCDDDGDEECVKRRLTSEAHLDYIYTQHHHKP